MSDEVPTWTMFCSACKADYNLGIERCPNCDNKLSRHATMNFTAEITPRASLKVVGRDATGEKTIEHKGGASRSADGTWAQSEQRVDRIEKRYSKKVVKEDGTVVKDVSGSLVDQSLHGPQAGPVSFDDLAARVNEILENRGHRRVQGEPSWCWENGVARVCLWAPPEPARHFPYLVTRRRYETGPDDERWLDPGTSEVSGEAGASADRLARIIEGELQNPY